MRGAVLGALASLEPRRWRVVRGSSALIVDMEVLGRLIWVWDQNRNLVLSRLSD